MVTFKRTLMVTHVQKSRGRTTCANIFGHSIPMLHIQRPYSHLEELCARSIMLTLHDPSWTCISWPTELSAALTKRSTLSDVVFGHFRLLGSLGTARQSYRRGFHQNHPLYMFNHGIENLDPLKKPVQVRSITEHGPIWRKMHVWWLSHIGNMNVASGRAFS